MKCRFFVFGIKGFAKPMTTEVNGIRITKGCANSFHN